MTKGNGKDRALALAETAKRISRLPPRQRLEALLDGRDARELVRATPAEDLYYAISEVGLQDATEIVQLASPGQFQTFVDLGGWKRDRIDPHQVLTWLRAARTDDPEAFFARFDELDPEVTSFVLRSFFTLHDLEEEPDVNPPGVTLETPEGRYLLELHAEGVELAALRAILNDLFARNPLESVRMLEATRWEAPAELEETALRFRSGRLEDLGFPPLERAVALFAWLDPDSVEKVRPAKGAPEGRAALARAPSGSLFDRALADLEETEQDSLLQELRAVANAALVAEIQDPGDLGAVREVGARVRDYLSLGLEHLCGGDEALAVEVLRAHETRRIFQVGFSLTLRLKFRVDRLAKAPLARLGETWLALPFEARTLSALRARRPLRALKVEGAEPVPFRSRRELEEASQVLARAEAQLALFAALLGGSPEAARERLGAFGQPLEVLGTSRLLNAAVAHAALGEGPKAAPFPPDRFDALGKALFEGTRDAPALKPGAQDRILAAFEALVEPAHKAAVRDAVAGALAALRDEVAPVWLSGGSFEPTLAEVLPTPPA